MTVEPLRRTCSAYDIPVLRVVRHGEHVSVHDLYIDAELELTRSAEADGGAIVRAAHALAAEHAAGEPERYAAAVAHYCRQRMQGVAAARVDVRTRSWDRLAVGGRPRDRDLVSPASALRVARVELSDAGERTGAGLRDVLLLSAGDTAQVSVLRLSAFWMYGWSDVPFATQWQQIRRALEEAFAERDRAAPGAIAQALGRAVLDQAPPVSEIEVTLEVALREPVDMTVFGMDDRGTVFGGPAAARSVHVARLLRSEIE
jgi:urate oxidase